MKKVSDLKFQALKSNIELIIQEPCEMEDVW